MDIKYKRLPLDQRSLEARIDQVCKDRAQREKDMEVGTRVKALDVASHLILGYTLRDTETTHNNYMKIMHYAELYAHWLSTGQMHPDIEDYADVNSR